MKNTIIILLSFLTISSFQAKSQSVGVGTITPDASAALEVKSNDKGMLIPRMTSYARTQITSPATGLMVYDTNTKTFWYYTGLIWKDMNPEIVPPFKKRSIYIAGNAVSFTPNAAITQHQWGISLASTANSVGFAIPRPVDWDVSKEFRVTLYYTFPSVPQNTIVRWRLEAGSNSINAPESTATNGWDSYGGYEDENMPSTLIYAAGGRNNLAKSVTWTAKFSNFYNTWYFGNSNHTQNSFSNASMWHFGFQRGIKISNGETYTGSLIITGISIEYETK